MTTPKRSARGFAAVLDQHTSGQLCYVQTKDETGYDAFYFLLLFPEKEEAFNALIGRPGMANLEEYGAIVASGYGRTPHKAAREKMFDLYGIDVQTLIENAIKQQKSGA